MSLSVFATLPRMHEAYNQVVRDVAGSSSDASVLDIAKQWSLPEEVKQDQKRFRGDRIHLTETGHQKIAEQLFLLWNQK